MRTKQNSHGSLLTPILTLTAVLTLSILFSSCKRNLFGIGSDEYIQKFGRDTNKSSRAFVDRFSDSAGILFKRSDPNGSFPVPSGFPKPNSPINFDQIPFITQGFDTKGDHVSYYNFDAHANGVHTDVIYHFYNEGDTTHQISKQLAIVNSLPGESSYNDFWQVVKVVVPKNYVANTVTSEDEIFSKKFKLIPTTTIVNCPIVPEGSTAKLRVGGGSNLLTKGWYKNQLCFYFTFLESNLTGTLTASGSDAPIDDIYVFFSINPNLPNGGPGSGFKVEPGTDQAHNLVASIPGVAGYSPLWTVSVLDNAFFNSVKTEADALSHVLGAHVADVNCPVVAIRK